MQGSIVNFISWNFRLEFFWSSFVCRNYKCVISDLRSFTASTDLSRLWRDTKFRRSRKRVGNFSSWGGGARFKSRRNLWTFLQPFSNALSLWVELRAHQAKGHQVPDLGQLLITNDNSGCAQYFWDLATLNVQARKDETKRSIGKLPLPNKEMGRNTISARPN